MRIMRLGPLFIVGLFFSGTSIQAQQSPTVATPARDPQAMLVLQAAIKAMGGGAPSDSAATGSVNATVGSESQDGTVQIFTRATDQSSEAVSLPNLSQTTIYSHWMAGQVDGSTAQQQLTDQLAATSQTALYPLPLLVGTLNNPDASLQYVGQETVDDAVTQHIRFWNTFASKPHLLPLAPFSLHDVWIDTSTGLPVKISFTQQAAAGRAFKTLVELNFSNYQQTSGFAYPYTIKKSLNGTPWLTISIQSVSFNTGLQYSQFQVNCSNSN
ncbi:MAG TPA: hypothetical protein VGR97_03830 [Candidatus Acidoferrales bacterium]|nr:hypothetical protein [Candidatus Acidoferrales bacterium]